MTDKQKIELLQLKISRLESKNKVLVQELRRFAKSALKVALKVVNTYDKGQDTKKDYPSF
jgi:FtsZ-binding cell division protein ZapB